MCVRLWEGMDIGYVLKSRRSSVKVQEDELRAHGVKALLVEGQVGHTFEHVLKQLQPGDRVKVRTISDLALNRRELRRRMLAIHAKGAHVFEISTGRRSSDKDQAIEMVFDGADQITNKGRGHSSAKATEYGSKGGRPKSKRSMSREEAEKIWFDTRHGTNDAALAKMLGWNLQAAYREFGGSKRPPGPRKPRKQKRERL